MVIKCNINGLTPLSYTVSFGFISVLSKDLQAGCHHRQTGPHGPGHGTGNAAGCHTAETNRGGRGDSLRTTEAWGDQGIGPTASDLKWMRITICIFLTSK